MIEVSDVERGSLAEKAGIRAYDKVISINNSPFNDIFDLVYNESGERLKLDIEGRESVIIVKQAYESIGLVFDKSFKIRRCNNKCLFCFIDQLPKGMRNTLYVKDDDYRLSLMTGSYITLTNLSEQDILRIIRYRMSPMYISVHAYDDNIRRRLVNNDRTRDMFNIMKRFALNGIIMHTQIVLCPDINDKEHLSKTLEELYKLYPSVETVSVVPVGLTSFRSGLYDIRPISREDAIEAIKITESINDCVSGTAQRGFCWCSDEMYLKAGIDMKPYQYYGDFKQIENGVGMVRMFEEGISYNVRGSGEYHLITGESFYPILTAVAKRLIESSGVSLIVHKVVNNYFGNTVTVAGLLTAKDIIEQIRDKVKGKKVIIPEDILNQSDSVTLDGMKIEVLSSRLNAEIITARDGEDIERIISGE